MYAYVLMDLPQQGRSIKAAVGVSGGLLTVDLACLLVKCMISSSWMGWHTEKPEKEEERQSVNVLKVV